MESFQVRTYGPSPCRAAVLHGGPGAIGSAAGLARGLAESCGVLEPLQSKYSVTEQVEELHRQLTAYASRPLVLIGHSWGAWLAALYAARHPGLAARLVLIGCGPLEAAYLPQLEARRLAHFTPEEAARYRELLTALSSPGSAPDALLRQLGTLCEKADNFQPFEEPDGDSGTIDGEMYDKVFGEEGVGAGRQTWVLPRCTTRCSAKRQNCAGTGGCLPLSTASPARSKSFTASTTPIRWRASRSRWHGAASRTRSICWSNAATRRGASGMPETNFSAC